MIAGLLLAAGRSSRFGSDKLCALIGQTPVVALSARVLAPLERIVVVTPPDDVRIRDALAPLSVEYVPNALRDTGMASSIRAGIAALGEDVEAVVIALGDQPFASAEVTRALMAEWEKGKSDVVVPFYREGRGHPVLFGAACFAALQAIEGDAGARSITELPHFRVTRLPIDEVGPVDVDTPGALALAAEGAPDDGSISPPSV